MLASHSLLHSSIYLHLEFRFYIITHLTFVNTWREQLWKPSVLLFVRSKKYYILSCRSRKNSHGRLFVVHNIRCDIYIGPVSYTEWREEWCASRRDGLAWKHTETSECRRRTDGKPRSVRLKYFQKTHTKWVCGLLYLLWSWVINKKTHTHTKSTYLVLLT